MTSVPPIPVGDLKATLTQLMELIAAIDRRLPQVQRAGESAIVNAATRLRIEAARRISEIELELAGQESTEPGPASSPNPAASASASMTPPAAARRSP